jgi:hypothetical protein
MNSHHMRAVNRFAAALEVALQQALELPNSPAKEIDLAIDPNDSPVGYQDTPEAFKRDLAELQSACEFAHAIELAGFSSELFALEWFMQRASGPCTVYLDSHNNFQMIGAFDPADIVSEAMAQVFEEAERDLEAPAAHLTPAAEGYWLLRRVQDRLLHPISY